MADEIIGTSVLQGNKLWICAYSSTFQGGFTHWSSIPITPVTESKLPSPSWQYRKEGNILHCQPSVHIQCQKGKNDKTMETLFHNQGSWTTSFIEVDSDIDGMDKCMELNRELVYSKKLK